MASCIISGSRSITSYRDIETAVNSSPFYDKITEVVSGTCRGPDKLGEEWAILHKIPIKRFPADWNKHGKAAGYIRNEEMAKYVIDSGGGYLIAVWDGKSRGTMSMISLAKQYGLNVYVYEAK